MLAPRKILWSTPHEAIEAAYNAVPLISRDDTVVDLGCGNGRVLVRWAELYWQNNLQVGQTVTGRSDDNDDCNNAKNKATVDFSNDIDSMPTFVGIDIDANRIQEAQTAWREAVQADRISPHMSVRFHCANALERMDLWTDSVTVLYVYLTPRGMRHLRPLLTMNDPNTVPDPTLLAVPKSQTTTASATAVPVTTTPHLRRVLSYMNPLPNAQLIQRELVHVPHQPDAAWPLFVYQA